MGHSLGDQAVVDQGLVDLRPQFRVEGGHCVVGGRRWYLDGCRRVLARHDVKKPRWVGWWRALRRRARCKAEEVALASTGSLFRKGRDDVDLWSSWSLAWKVKGKGNLLLVVSRAVE